MLQVRYDERRSARFIGPLLALMIVLTCGLPDINQAAAANNLSSQSQEIQPLSSKPGRNGRIAYASNEAGSYDIYTINADATGKTRLTSGAGDNLDPSYSPSGLKIAFISNRDGNFQIYVMNADGTSQTRLTNNAGSDFDPTWSPDGVRLAFTSERDGNEEIYVMNADGTGQINLTNNPADDAFPTWSPDSAKLAFSSDRSGNAEIFSINADGSNPVNLTNNQANDDFPAWSPDGSKIAFSSDRSGSTFNIYLMNANGGAQVRFSVSQLEETYPAWSPDSKRLVFMQGTFSDEGFTNDDLLVVDLTGANPATLTFQGGDDITPDWQSLSVAGGPFANPIDDPRVFVRQQYLDFLNREPDPGGLDYWTSQITNCGNNERCINEQRINVSAAFFIEQEFQQTGYFIIRLYRAAFGRRPTFAEFQSDRNRLSVGNLEASKTAFLEDFIRRQEFADKYAASMNGQQFIDALIKTINDATGVDLSSRRNEFISDFNSNASRARIVRLAVDDARLVQAEYNRAFVLAEYFGYLRRDPDEGGYQFWLNVLNNREPNNYRGMVCAFITSAEYQLRFGAVTTRTNRDCASIR